MLALTYTIRSMCQSILMLEVQQLLVPASVRLYERLSSERICFEYFQAIDVIMLQYLPAFTQASNRPYSVFYERHQDKTVIHCSRCERCVVLN
jgi:hypothetical protein